MRRALKPGLVVLAGFIVIFMALENRGGAQMASTKIFVNNVDVTGLADQEFKNCTVKFDAKGNVWIDAPGYKVKKLDSADSASSSSSSSSSTTPKKKTPASTKFFLVTESKQGEKVWDSYSLIINGSVVKKFESSDGVILEDITKHINKGTNQILLTASKKSNFPGATDAPYYKIIIGQGHEDGKQIVIDKSLLRFTRKGTDTNPDSKSLTLEAK